MTQGKLPNRIPFEEVGQVTHWMMPPVGGKVVPSVQREAQKKPLPKQPHETVETLTPEELPEVQITPLKASELQEITEAAARDGFNQGYEEGLAKGLASGEQQGFEQGQLNAYTEHSHALQQQTQALAQLCQALMHPIEQQERQLENLILNLAVELAQHLIKQELHQRPEAIYPIVQAALASLPQGEKALSLFVHPDDLPFIQTQAQAQGKNWHLHADTGLTRGSCRIEKGASTVEYALNERLNEWVQQAQQNTQEMAPILKNYLPVTALTAFEAPDKQPDAP